MVHSGGTGNRRVDLLCRLAAGRCAGLQLVLQRLSSTPWGALSLKLQRRLLATCAAARYQLSHVLQDDLRGLCGSVRHLHRWEAPQDNVEEGRGAILDWTPERRNIQRALLCPFHAVIGR